MNSFRKNCSATKRAFLSADPTGEEELGLDGDDLDMSVATAIARRSGRSLEGTQSNPYYGRVMTASDLVYFFNGQSEVAPQATAFH